MIDNFRHHLMSPTSYEPYNAWHLIAIAFGICLFAIIYFCPKQEKYKKSIAYFLGFCTLSSVTISCFSYHVYPLHLCDMSALLIVPLALFLKSKICRQILLCISLFGALVALTVPSLDPQTSLIRFLIFFTMHIGIVLAAAYVFIHHRPEINWQTLIYVFCYLNAYIIFIEIIQHITKSYYSYLSHPPTLTPGLLAWPWYIGEAELAILLFSTIFIFTKKPNRRHAAPTQRQHSIHKDIS